MANISRSAASIATSCRTKLLVMSWAWHSTPERESLLTISLKPDGAGTLLTLHHEQFFGRGARDGHEKGWTELLGKLEQSLT